MGKTPDGKLNKMADNTTDHVAAVANPEVELDPEIGNGTGAVGGTGPTNEVSSPSQCTEDRE